MKKVILIFFLAAILNYLLVTVGRLISYSIFFNRNDSGSESDAERVYDLITFLLIQSFIVYPVSAIIGGIFVGWYAERKAWWLAAISLLPVLIYVLIINSWAEEEIFLSIIYLGLAMFSATIISLIKMRFFRTLRPKN